MKILRFSIINIDQKYRAESYQMDNNFVTRKQTGMAKNSQKKTYSLQTTRSNDGAAQNTKKIKRRSKVLWKNKRILSINMDAYIF